MKKIVAIVSIFAFLTLQGCTNDEGDQDVEIITPEEETQREI